MMSRPFHHRLNSSCQRCIDWDGSGDRQGCMLTRVEGRKVRTAIGKIDRHMGVVYELDRYRSGILPEDDADQGQKSAPGNGSMMIPPSFNLLTSSVCANPTERCMVRRNEWVSQPLSPKSSPATCPHGAITWVIR